jgi:DNA-binding response OmpR family regulator
MVTAKSGPQDIEAGREAGADHYITKPFRLAELVGKIAELVG